MRASAAAHGWRQAWQSAAWRKLARLLPLVFALFYLSFHAISGERGIYAWFKESRKLAALQEQLAQVKAERDGYERKIARLNARNVDLDLLDEQARRVLGFVGKDEVVVPLPAEKR